VVSVSQMLTTDPATELIEATLVAVGAGATTLSALSATTEEALLPSPASLPAPMA